ncbi:hypothetical protein BGZ95_005779 [Linnemannia exigua]|uniref:GSKIP domain-containing protein n=1 Tax=Linnemannia exigua TaxID=604196 RepID=A0AAD4H1D7_9FUNG|nr:hypothetical protein BGZ95_005779 [Linnemannia exigua]
MNSSGATMSAMDMIPDLTHYSQGLSLDTFPLKVTTSRTNNLRDNSNTDNQDNESDLLAVNFMVVTLEQGTAEITLDGQGFRVVTFSLSQQAHSQLLSARQQEAVSGLTYETIEALLMALSPDFEAFFGQELTRKLENVSSWEQTRFQYSSDDSANESNDER